jgi:hypothetical protein
VFISCVSSRPTITVLNFGNFLDDFLDDFPVRYGSELIRCLSPSHPPDHEVLNFFFNYQVNKMSCALEMAAAPINEIID